MLAKLMDDLKRWNRGSRKNWYVYSFMQETGSLRTLLMEILPWLPYAKANTTNLIICESIRLYSNPGLPANDGDADACTTLSTTISETYPVILKWMKLVFQNVCVKLMPTLENVFPQFQEWTRLVELVSSYMRACNVAKMMEFTSDRLKPDLVAMRGT